jgi:hypothetical protein
MTESRSVITYRTGGRDYPLKTVRNCKVCKSPYRFDIEEHIIGGRTYKRIIDSLPEDHEVSADSVKRHYLNGHMPLEQSVHRQMVERRASQIGKSIDDAADSLIDGITLLESVVQRTFDRLASGEVKPELRDGVQAASLLAQLGEYDQQGVDQQAIVEAFIVYHQNAERFMTSDQFQKFGEALDKSPVLAALARRFDENAEHETVPGEVTASSSVD